MKISEINKLYGTEIKGFECDGVPEDEDVTIIEQMDDYLAGWYSFGTFIVMLGVRMGSYEEITVGGD